MKILITGGAGVLGSSLAGLFLGIGHKVSVLDHTRKEEAWRLYDDISSIDYLWKSETDICGEDLSGTDVVIDCAIGSADRPFGASSPNSVTFNNLFPPLALLENVRKLKNPPITIYPSSFNALYGYGQITFTENLLPSPASMYGWTKASSELLYRSHSLAYNTPIIITRTSSSFGPGGRSDELPHKLILTALSGVDRFQLRSPHSKRLWTYVGDVISFYKLLIEKIESDKESILGKTLHLAGNKDEKIITNTELAESIQKVSQTTFEVIPSSYEPGETTQNAPLSFLSDNEFTKNLLGWHPSWTLEDGLHETFRWFERNKSKYLM
jgi:nucleoside-diphosphate-sugar epimerase